MLVDNATNETLTLLKLNLDELSIEKLSEINNNV